MIKRVALENVGELKKVFAVVHQLRKHLTFETFQKIIAQSKNERYEMWAYLADGQPVGVVGLRVYTDLVRGPHLYIDDLVVSETHRSQKIGAQLLEFARVEAKSRGLETLRLACALSNEGGMKFYEREGWTRRSYSYVKDAEATF